LLVRLPTSRGAEVLDTIEGARAAAALAAVHPELGADLVEVLAPERALALLGQMPDDEAADALRAADEERRARLLAAMDGLRAQQLRAAIGRPRPPVAGGPRPPRRYWHVLRGHAGFRR
jgi:Mg/Co/Ni transporter MgtE